MLGGRGPEAKGGKLNKTSMEITLSAVLDFAEVFKGFKAMEHKHRQPYA